MICKQLFIIVFLLSGLVSAFFWHRSRLHSDVIECQCFRVNAVAFSSRSHAGAMLFLSAKSGFHLRAASDIPPFNVREFPGEAWPHTWEVTIGGRNLGLTAKGGAESPTYFKVDVSYPVLLCGISCAAATCLAIYRYRFHMSLQNID